MVFRVKLLIVLAVLPFLGGCLGLAMAAATSAASNVVAGKAQKYTDQPIYLATEPSGAAASVIDTDGETVASCDSTPCNVMLHGGMRHPLEVTFSMEGCEDAALTLGLLEQGARGLAKVLVPTVTVIEPPSVTSLNCATIEAATTP